MAIPGERFQAGAFWRWFYGDNYRDLWTTAIEFPVLDLDTVGGGLTPLRTGGFGQSISLHFTGEDGLRYTVRSLDKDPTRRLADELQNSLVSELLHDLISTLLPAAALVVDPLMEATGILHSKHTLAVIPDDPRLGEYREERAELSTRRQAFARRTSGDTLRVEVNRFADCSDLPERLREELGIEAFREDRKLIAEWIAPQQGKDWDWASLDGVVADIRAFQSGAQESWETKDARFAPRLRDLPAERVDRLALYLPEDVLDVSFRSGASRSWQPIAQGSPGQQTAALLAFVLGFGSEPIVLDQPEDDLDSTLIYELLVKRFRETKPERQLIVVTHNPNIVVHGDAEYVVSLRVRDSQTAISCDGGLQEDGVRDEICRVMEGGREAFESRYRRIMPLRDVK